MPAVARFDFPAGRYHATPWGRHVNEGAVEWPPSPWRLLRALVATGFNRFGWGRPAPAEAVSLIEKLASAAPAFALPPASSAHTRHYMRLFDGKTTRVLDTFATLARVDAPLHVRWPVDLTDTELKTLDELLRAMPYLGRAESWVDARLTSPQESLDWIEPGARPANAEVERVDLLTPLPADALAAPRENVMSRRANAPRPSERRSRSGAARAMGDRAASVFEVLLADTGRLQREGWSQPPGTRWTAYWRPLDALDAPLAARPPRVARAKPLTAVLYAVTSETRAGKTLPPLTDALRRAEVVHRSLVAHTPSGTPAVQFSGTNEGAPARGHRHPSVACLSMELVEGGSTLAHARIDHVLVTAHREVPFDAAAVEALRRLRETYAKNVSRLWLTRLWERSVDDSSSSFPFLASARVWVSHTPYLAPRHVKRGGRNTLEGQLRMELEQRGIEGLECVEVSVERNGQLDWLGAGRFFEVWRTPSTSLRLDPRWRRFRTTRTKDAAPTPIAQPALSLRLTFRNDVEGPVAAGYGSHLGLGLFVASR